MEKNDFSITKKSKNRAKNREKTKRSQKLSKNQKKRKRNQKSREIEQKAENSQRKKIATVDNKGTKNWRKINRKKTKKTKQRKKTKLRQITKNPKETKNQHPEKNLKSQNFFRSHVVVIVFFSAERILKMLMVKIYSKRV